MQRPLGRIAKLNVEA